MEVVQTKLVNDVISIQNSGIDWVAWIALGVSILATIGTLIWQNHIRNKDLERQRKEKEADDKMRKWSAEYPHKLKLFTDFYDVLFRFVNYKGSPRQMPVSSGKDMTFVQIHVDDLLEFYSQINRIDEECKILFPGEIEHKVHEVYEIINEFIYATVCEEKGNIFNVTDILENNKQCLVYKNVLQNLEKAQEDIKYLKLGDDLRQKFIKALECKGLENE